MDFLNAMIDSYNIPLLTAFLLGVMTSISPCPLATNVTAIGYVSRNVSSTKYTMFHSILYALGRTITYSFIALLIWFGLSQFYIANLFQEYGDKFIGPVLILIGLVMLNIIKLPSWKGPSSYKNLQENLNKKGLIGTFLLGILFALAFCPYSGMIFFGMLMPLVMNSTFPLGLSTLYGVGTALPVIIFAILLVISIQKMSKAFNAMGKIEKYLRYFISSIFVIVGIYYSYITVKWLILIL